MAYVTTRLRPGTSNPPDGSRTITITPTPAVEGEGEGEGEGGEDERRENEFPAEGQEDGDPGQVGTLRLTGGSSRRGPRVVWDEDVVDNEGAGRKSSKSTSSL